jgi:hypothetical protein
MLPTFPPGPGQPLDGIGRVLSSTCQDPFLPPLWVPKGTEELAALGVLNNLGLRNLSAEWYSLWPSKNNN